ncbi:MAG: 30S ribosomal protein S17 [Chloroflexi bacterium]|nr:30S ribosomal protein S17 [Chloroflexota bacterium]
MAERKNETAGGEGASPASAPGPRTTVDGRKPRRTMTGRVVSDKMDKTIVVSVERVTQHRLYGRTVRSTKRFKAHDEANACVIGDSVIIEESRPLSKDKHWNLQRILRKGTGEAVAIQEVEA